MEFKGIVATERFMSYLQENNRIALISEPNLILQITSFQITANYRRIEIIGFFGFAMLPQQ